GEAVFHRCGVALGFPRVTPRPIDAQAAFAWRVFAGDMVLVIRPCWRWRAHGRCPSCLSFPQYPVQVPSAWRLSWRVALAATRAKPPAKVGNESGIWAKCSTGVP